MKAVMESTLSLESVAEHFEQWRSSKKKGERIPEHLWCEALELLGRYRISQVVRTLRLSGADLNKRRGIRGGGRRRKRTAPEAAFVEIDRTEVAQASERQATASWMELQRPDGLRLRIHPSEGGELLALVERFMRA
jgi:hypothetical protein